MYAKCMNENIVSTWATRPLEKYGNINTHTHTHMCNDLFLDALLCNFFFILFFKFSEECGDGKASECVFTVFAISSFFANTHNFFQ